MTCVVVEAPRMFYTRLMPDPERQSRPDEVGFPDRQILARVRNASGWRSSMLTRPNQSLGSFLLELLTAAAFWAILAFLVIRLST